jgi:2-dehydro-3-deoxygluconokinase
VKGRTLSRPAPPDASPQDHHLTGSTTPIGPECSLAALRHPQLTASKAFGEYGTMTRSVPDPGAGGKPVNQPKCVVSFGEMLLRLSPPGHERFFQSARLNAFFGGSEANVAMSLAHFGVQSRYVTRLPANPAGDAAVSALRAEGVETAGILRGGARMGLYFVESGADLRPLRVVYDRAGSAFSQVDPSALDWTALLDGADWFHVSGISPALGAGPRDCVRDALAAARAAGITTSLDLNYRPAVWDDRDPYPVIHPLASACDVVIGNPGAVATMLRIETAGIPPEAPDAVRRTAERLCDELGCRLVALTQREALSASEHGWRASLYDAASATMHQSRRYQVRLVDRVGGGDSFVAGLLYAMLAGRGRGGGGGGGGRGGGGGGA